jgi:large subunit ribosomal protein L29
MAKKKEKKDKNYAQLSVEELTQQADKAREDLFRVRFKMASATTTNTMQVRALRREIARLETFKNQSLSAKKPVQKAAVAQTTGRAKS